MDLGKLKVGMEFKTYKELCGFLGENVKKANSKKAQIKEWQRYFGFHKLGQKIIIDEIYSEPKPKNDMRGKMEGSRNNGVIDDYSKKYKNFKISKENQKSIGVYAIILNNNIYIGSTTVGFNKRFRQHKDKNNKSITKKMLENRASFVMLKNMNGCSEKEIRYEEDRYINHYLNNKNWNVVNCKKAWNCKENNKIKNIKAKKVKVKNIKIKVKEEDYDKAKEIIEKALKENGINIYNGRIK